MPTSSRFSEVEIPCGEVVLEGDLTVPGGACGIVLFAHGSGSSRRSPRNRYVAEQIKKVGLGTLPFDLLTTQEAHTEAFTLELRFNIPFLTASLHMATCWVRENPSLSGLDIGYFGASTALAAATDDPSIKAAISRGGRTDLAGTKVENVRAATLLIVGALDQPVIQWNRETFELLTCEKSTEVVKGATHLFVEQGALETVSELAAHWFNHHLKNSDDNKLYIS